MGVCFAPHCGGFRNLSWVTHFTFWILHIYYYYHFQDWSHHYGSVLSLRPRTTNLNQSLCGRNAGPNQAGPFQETEASTTIIYFCYAIGFTRISIFLNEIFIYTKFQQKKWCVLSETEIPEFNWTMPKRIIELFEVIPLPKRLSSKS